MKDFIINKVLGTFYANTPSWAKHLILVIITLASGVFITAISNPEIIPKSLTQYIGMIALFLVFGLQMIGKKVPKEILEESKK